MAIYVIRIKNAFSFSFSSSCAFRIERHRGRLKRTSIIINLLWNFYKQHENPLHPMLSIFYVLCCTRRSPKAERDGDKKFVRNTDFLCNNAFYHFLVFLSFGNYYRRLLFSSRVYDFFRGVQNLLKLGSGTRSENVFCTITAATTGN